MSLQGPNFGSDCPVAEFSAYIDGELSLENTELIEAHLAMCDECSREMEQQKLFLCALNSSFSVEQEIELPKDFARVVAVNAESRVSGVRRPTELFNALFVCVALAIFVLFTIGPGTSPLGPVVQIFDQIAAVGGFVLHLGYDLTIGAVVIIRSLASQLRSGTGIEFSLLVFLFAVLSFVLSRYLIRLVRVVA
ncbi:MAG: zf-HC2 domain-containing protein [Pyrinomonadaceae bacterium]